MGGFIDDFLAMCRMLRDLIDEDLKKDIIAIWHDESFVNKYIIDRDDVQILGRRYCSHEGYVYPYDAIFVCRNKHRYISKKNGRFNGRENWLHPFLIRARNVKWRVLIMTGRKPWEPLKDEKGQWLETDISYKLKTKV